MPKSIHTHDSQRAKKSLKRKKKVRTRVAGDGSSTSDCSDHSTAEHETGSNRTPNQQGEQPLVEYELPHATEDVTASDEEEHSDQFAQPEESESSESFSSFYLKNVTSAFPDDLDKIRNAGDFTDASLPLLVLALQQGEECFSAEEKRAVETALKSSK